MGGKTAVTRTFDVEVEAAQGRRAYSVGVTVHEPAGVSSGCALLYFHGGAFVCGWRDDLPTPYVDMICGAGHTLMCVDYPLAPECPMGESIDAAFCVVERLLAGLSGELGCERYALFGRSAGAYLALMLARRIAARSDLPCPVAIWDFYGYWDLADPFFHAPSKLYGALPAVGDAAARAQLVDASAPLTNAADRVQRVLVYVWSRQQNTWLELLGVEGDEAVAEFSLTEEDVAALPPLFIAASTGDEDVPFRQSKRLLRLSCPSKLHTVYYLEHDFDRLVDKPDGRVAYAAALEFLSTCLAEKG